MVQNEIQQVQQTGLNCYRYGFFSRKFECFSGNRKYQILQKFDILGFAKRTGARQRKERYTMSLQKAEQFLQNKGFLDHVIRLEESTATVVEAAEALGVEPGRIAKTMSFLQGEQAVLILTEGTARVDNRKYKDTFHMKARMIPFEEVEAIIGHAPGGVCPFGVHEGIAVYLDESLKAFDTVYPAAGDDHSAVKLTIAELEQVCDAKGWVDVCKAQ